jgi:hypothetical protein
MAKQLFNVTITREVTYTIYDVVANSPEEAESIAESEDLFGLELEKGDLCHTDVLPSEEDE